MMKRRIFFWLEKLKITPAERKTVSALMIILSLLAIGNMVISPPEPFGGDHYAELEKRFRERTAQLTAEKEKRMKRYYPPAKDEAILTAVADTVSEDSTSAEKPNSAEQTIEKPYGELVNVNVADQERLKTLPGIGPAYSKRIIQYRENHGGFKTVEELKKIKGIGEKRLEKLKPFIKLKASQ